MHVAALLDRQVAIRIVVRIRSARKAGFAIERFDAIDPDAVTEGEPLIALRRHGIDPHDPAVAIGYVIEVVQRVDRAHRIGYDAPDRKYHENADQYEPKPLRATECDLGERRGIEGHAEETYPDWLRAAGERARGLSAARSDHATRDHHALNLLRSFVDLGDLRIAHHPFDRILGRIPEAA